jgi:hypothetical protein
MSDNMGTRDHLHKCNLNFLDTFNQGGKWRSKTGKFIVKVNFRKYALLCCLFLWCLLER